MSVDYDEARRGLQALLTELSNIGSFNAYDDPTLPTAEVEPVSTVVESGEPEDHQPTEEEWESYLRDVVEPSSTPAEIEPLETPNHVPAEPVIRCPHCHQEMRYSQILAGGEGFPISDYYIGKGVVEECGELVELWEGFLQAQLVGKPLPVRLDSGTYEMQGGMNEGFTLTDAAKGFLYMEESGRAGQLADVEPDDLFIWILRADDPEGEDLGYILNGWVFVRKSVLPE